jgi:hypothetical protein
MKKLLAMLLMLVILITAMATPVLGAGPSLHTATGGGTVEQRGYSSEDTYKNGYTFTVQQLDENGNAKGHFVAILGNGSEFRHREFKADLKYVYFEGNIVYMSGVITHCYRPQAIGKGLLFGAIDYGEGSQAAGLDKVSMIVTGTPIDAAINEAYRNFHLGDPPVGFELTNGNIQIR